MPAYHVIRVGKHPMNQPHSEEEIVGTVEGRDPMDAEKEARRLMIMGYGGQWLRLRKIEASPVPPKGG